MNTATRMRRRLGALAALALVVSFVFMAERILAGGSLLQYAGGEIVEISWDPSFLPLGYRLSSPGYPGSGISNAQIEAELTSAIAQYNALPESAVALTFDGEIDISDSGGLSILGAGIDGVNLVTFSDPDLTFAPGVAAVCALNFINEELVIDASNNDLNGDGIPDLPDGTYPPGTILDADVVFNGNIGLDVSGVDATADVQAIALHEFGHCVGMSHSSVRDAVMFPFQSADVASARMLKEDDVAHVSDKYPLEPAYSNAYGSVQGRVTSGITGLPVVGAHVYTADTTTREAIVGGYTGPDGTYRLPARSGLHFVGIEPLDGEPIGLDPERINSVIADTPDVLFTEEFYDAAESGTDDPTQAQLLLTTAGDVNGGIDVVTNTVDAVSASLLLARGVNYVSYPVAVPAGVTSFDLLAELAGVSGVGSIKRYNVATGQFESAHLVNGVPAGYDFPIRRFDGYQVNTSADELVSFGGAPDCPVFDLAVGVNLIGAPCAPAGYSAYDLLADLGGEQDVIGVQGWDAGTGTWQVAQFSAETPTGTDFAIADGGAYLVEMRVARTGFRINASNAAFPPSLTSISPGQAVPGSVVTLKGVGFSPDPTQNVVLFNELGAELLTVTTQQIVARVPAQALSGTVQVLTQTLASNALPFDVLPALVAEIEGQMNDIISGQAIDGAANQALDVDEYRFLAIEGNRITATLRSATAGVPELSMELLNPLGGALARETNGAGTLAIIRDFAAPESGFYTLRVSALAGTGPYTLELRLDGVPGTPRIIAIAGDYQTGVMGTALPTPLQLVAVDESGLPASGVPLAISVTNLSARRDASEEGKAPAAVRAEMAGDMSTPSAGVLQISVELPDMETGDFEITIAGQSGAWGPVTLLVTSISRAIASATMTPADIYTCGVSGCEVDQVVDMPYELVFMDTMGQPIEDVLIEWAVISGGGKVQESQGGAGEDKIRTRSDAAGRVQAWHRLGQLVHFPDRGGGTPTGEFYDPFRPLVTIPHQVVATIPGQPVPATLSAQAKAGEAAIIRSLRAQNQRVTMGSAALGLISFFIGDQFGNPIENASVSWPLTTPGLIPAQGFLNGQVFTGNLSNASGLWSAGIGVMDDGSLETPSINEFGESIAPPVTVDFTINGGPTIQYFVTTDLGPSMVAEGIGTTALIGRYIAADTLSFTTRRFRRKDTFIYVGDVDDDDGDWQDEDYTEMLRLFVGFATGNVTIRRDDGKRGLMQYSQIPITTIDDEMTYSGDTNNFGKLSLPQVQLGGVYGGVNFIADMGEQTIEYYFDGGLQPFRSETFLIPKAALPVAATPVILTVDIEDPRPDTGGAPRVYPGVDLASGVDVGNLSVTVNGAAMFSEAVLGTAFPYFASLQFNGQGAQGFGDGLAELRPQSVRLIYYPTSNQLMIGDMNEVMISQYLDDVGHQGVAQDPAADTDASDTTVTFEFSYP